MDKKMFEALLGWVKSKPSQEGRFSFNDPTVAIILGADAKHLEPKQFLQLLAAIKPPPTSVDFTGLPLHGAFSSDKVMKWFMDNPQLTSINFGNSRLSYSDGISIANILKDHTGLRDITLQSFRGAKGEARYHDHTVSANILTGLLLSRNDNLRSVDLGGLTLKNDTGAQHLRTLLSSPGGPTSFALHGAMTDSAMQTFVRELEEDHYASKHIQQLDFAVTNTNGEYVELHAGANPSIRHYLKQDPESSLLLYNSRKHLNRIQDKLYASPPALAVEAAAATTPIPSAGFDAKLEQKSSRPLKERDLEKMLSAQAAVVEQCVDVNDVLDVKRYLSEMTKLCQLAKDFHSAKMIQGHDPKDEHQNRINTMMNIQRLAQGLKTAQQEFQDAKAGPVDISRLINQIMVFEVVDVSPKPPIKQLAQGIRAATTVQHAQIVAVKPHSPASMMAALTAADAAARAAAAPGLAAEGKREIPETMGAGAAPVAPEPQPAAEHKKPAPAATIKPLRKNVLAAAEAQRDIAATTSKTGATQKLKDYFIDLDKLCGKLERKQATKAESKGPLGAGAAIQSASITQDIAAVRQAIKNAEDALKKPEVSIKDIVKGFIKDTHAVKNSELNQATDQIYQYDTTPSFSVTPGAGSGA